MNTTGILIGVITFLLIGLFHPIVIKAEYYFSKKIWPLFAAVGFVLLIISLLLDTTFSSTICAVIGVTCLWSIKELFEQEKRVEKGWFPHNPNRKK